MMIPAAPSCCASSSARATATAAGHFTRQSCSKPVSCTWPVPRCCGSPWASATPAGLHTAKILRLSGDLPLLIEIVDSEEKIATFLQVLEPMMGSGLVTTEKVQVIQYGPNGASKPAQSG